MDEEIYKLRGVFNDLTDVCLKKVQLLPLLNLHSAHCHSVKALAPKCYNFINGVCLMRPFLFIYWWLGKSLEAKSIKQWGLHRKFGPVLKGKQDKNIKISQDGPKTTFGWPKCIPKVSRECAILGGLVILGEWKRELPVFEMKIQNHFSIQTSHKT